MKQTKLQSMQETFARTGIAYVIGLLANAFLWFPLFNLDGGLKEASMRHRSYIHISKLSDNVYY